MDPLTSALQLLEEAKQIIAMQSEEIQALRSQIKGGMKKQASVKNLSAIVGMREEEIPEFMKTASEDEARSFISTLESRIKHTTLGKVAEISDGVSGDVAQDFEYALSSIIGR